MKLAISLGAVLAVLLAGSAQAQTTTNCHDKVYGQPQLGITCESNGPIDTHQLPAKRCSAIDHVMLNETICGARAVAADRKAVTDQIAAGDCSGALKAALSLGDMQFAREVRDFCGK